MIKTQEKININVPINEVMELFKNQDYFKHWQKGLISSKNLSTSIGKVGSKRSMKIKVASSSITMEEQITKVDLPHLWEATYRTKGVLNLQSNRFRESVTTINNKEIRITHWEAISIFKFTGMMRLISKANPSLFTSQTSQHMKDFKIFAENKTATRNNPK